MITEKEWRGILKNARCKFNAQTHSDGIMSANLTICWYENSLDRYFTIRAQAHKSDSPSVQGDRFRSFPGFTGFYAVGKDIRLGIFGVDNEGQTAEALFKLLRKRIQLRNYDRLAGDCALTPIVRALADFGCDLNEVMVNDKSFGEWRRENEK